MILLVCRFCVGAVNATTFLYTSFQRHLKLHCAVTVYNYKKNVKALKRHNKFSDFRVFG